MFERLKRAWRSIFPPKVPPHKFAGRAWTQTNRWADPEFDAYVREEIRRDYDEHKAIRPKALQSGNSDKSESKPATENPATP